MSSLAKISRPPSTTDRYLRSWGFAIAGRPANGAVTWRDRLTGKVMTEAKAIELAKSREKASKA